MTYLKTPRADVPANIESYLGDKNASCTNFCFPNNKINWTANFQNKPCRN